MPMPSPDVLPGPSDPTTGATAVTSAGAAEAHSNGAGDAAHDPGEEPPRRRPPGPSTKPALIVLGLTLVLFALGVLLEILSGSQSRPTTAPASITTARGAVLHAVPARPLLRAITTAGQPPDDLLNAIAVPRGATAVPGTAVNRGVELFDRSVRINVAATEQDVISFFTAQLPAQHWRRLSEGPARGVPGYQILERHPASDGREWEIGVTVSPTLFAGPAAPANETTAFTVRLFAVSDQA
jgi:hypothetical protein